MDDLTQMIATVICSVMASSGLWAFLQAIYTRKAKHEDKNDLKSQMLVGLAHDRITSLGMEYIGKGYIYSDEYENLYEYLYKPYEALGGNGSAKRIMDAVDKLEIRSR